MAPPDRGLVVLVARLSGGPELSAALLRRGLAHLGCDPAAADGLHRSTRGRPCLPAPFDCSVAHCEGRTVCAVRVDGPVGVDVEAIGPARAAEFRRYLTARERAWAGDDARRFHRLWTQKEAIAKGAGDRGLAALPAFEMVRGHAVVDDARWATAAVPAGRAFVAHVATPDRRPTGIVLHVAFDPARDALRTLKTGALR